MVRRERRRVQDAASPASEAASLYSQSPRPVVRRRTCVEVTFDSPGLDSEHLVSGENFDIFLEFKAAVGRALVEDAGLPQELAERVEVQLVRGGASASRTVSTAFTASTTLDLFGAWLFVPPMVEDAEAVAKGILDRETLSDCLASHLSRAKGLRGMFCGEVEICDVQAQFYQRPRSQQQQQQPRRDLRAAPRSPASPQAAGPAAPSETSSAGVARATQKEDHLVAAALSALQTRFGCQALRLGARHRQKLAAPLREVLAIFRACEMASLACKGYAQMCKTPSMRIFQHRLTSDDEICEARKQPDPVRQVQDSLDYLLDDARRAQQSLLDTLFNSKGHKEWPLGMINQRPTAVPMGVRVYNPGAKDRAAADAKNLIRYAPTQGRGCYWNLLDLARVTVLFATVGALQSSLERLIHSDKLDVVMVRNHYRNPSRLGLRWVDVYVALNFEGANGQPSLHVCEIRLEEESWFKARQEDSREPLGRFFDSLRMACAPFSTMDLEVACHMARGVLESPPESSGLRHLRRRAAQHFGTSITAWREMAGGRHIAFARFREMCQLVLPPPATNWAKKREQDRTESFVSLWMELDAGAAGRISLFDFDQEALVALTRFRSRAIAFAEDGQQDGVDSGQDATTKLEALLRQVRSLTHCAAKNSFNQTEFRSLGQLVGMTTPDADKILCFIDQHGGRCPPFAVRDADLGWALGLGRLVDLRAACLEHDEVAPQDGTDTVLRPCEVWGNAREQNDGDRYGWNFSQPYVDTGRPTPHTPWEVEEAPLVESMASTRESERREPSKEVSRRKTAASMRESQRREPSQEASRRKTMWSMRESRRQELTQDDVASRDAQAATGGRQLSNASLEQAPPAARRGSLAASREAVGREAASREAVGREAASREAAGVSRFVSRLVSRAASKESSEGLSPAAVEPQAGKRDSQASRKGSLTSKLVAHASQRLSDDTF